MDTKKEPPMAKSTPPKKNKVPPSPTSPATPSPNVKRQTISPSTPFKQRRNSSTQAVMTPTKSLTADLLKLDISPARGDRAAPGKDKSTAELRTVQEPNVHSSEEFVLVWKLEQYIVDCVQASADNPGTILKDRNGDIQDIIKSLHNLKKMYRDMKVGIPAKYLKSTSVLTSTHIEVLIDSLRVHINTSKHEREHGGIVFGTDLRAVTQSSRLVRSCLLLSVGCGSIAPSKPITSIPRFAKLERTWIMRLILARQNATAAVSKTNLGHWRSRLKLQHHSTFPRSVKNLSLDLLPLVRWVDVRLIIKQCRDSIEDVFLSWITRYRYENGFDQIYPYVRQKDIPELVRLVRKHLLTGIAAPAMKSNTKNYFNLRDGSEASYIIDTVQLEHNLANHYSHLHDITAWGTAHEFFCILGGAIDVMTVLKGTTHKFFTEALKLFDTFLYIFTDAINIRSPGLIPQDLNVLDSLLESAPGVSFYDLDFDAASQGNMNQFKLVSHWEIPEEGESKVVTSDIQQAEYPSPKSPSPAEEISARIIVESLIERGKTVWEYTGGYIAIVGPADWKSWDTITLIKRIPPSKEMLYEGPVECLKKALEEIFDLPCTVIDWARYIADASKEAETITEETDEDLYG